MHIRPRLSRVNPALTTTRPPRGLALPLATSLLALLCLPTWARAQCAVCGNPAFTSDDNDIARTFGGTTPRALRLSGGLAYSYAHMADLYAGTTRQPVGEKSARLNTREWALDAHLLTLMAGVELSSGTALALLVPMGRTGSTRAVASSPTIDADAIPYADFSDFGVADIELRVRQRLNRVRGRQASWLPQLVASVGVVAPTGNFTVKDSTSANSDPHVSLGRGAWWALAGLDLYGRVSDRVGWALHNQLRHALHDNLDSGYRFRWGTEVSSDLSATFVIVPGVLNAALTGALQWRDSGQERASETDPVADFANGGGLWFGINPTVQAVIGGGVSVTAAVRVPVARDVNGCQPVPGVGVVLALSWAWDIAPANEGPQPALTPGDAPTEAAVVQLLVPGKVTLVAYEAAWCVVCKRLRPWLTDFASSREDVVLRRVDVTGWPAARMKRVLPAQPGLPVLDIYGPDGRLIARVWGAQTFQFASLVPAAKK